MQPQCYYIIQEVFPLGENHNNCPFCLHDKLTVGRINMRQPNGRDYRARCFSLECPGLVLIRTRSVVRNYQYKDYGADGLKIRSCYYPLIEGSPWTVDGVDDMTDDHFSMFMIPRGN
jgi:hypothetical protein